MPILTSYLHRRGDALFFRIAVPLALRPYVGGREITKILRTTDRRVAIPRALLLTSRALQLFSDWSPTSPSRSQRRQGNGVKNWRRSDVMTSRHSAEVISDSSTQEGEYLSLVTILDGYWETIWKKLPKTQQQAWHSLVSGDIVLSESRSETDSSRCGMLGDVGV
jgi:hypothetical protein